MESDLTSTCMPLTILWLSLFHLHVKWDNLNVISLPFLLHILRSILKAVLSMCTSLKLASILYSDRGILLTAYEFKKFNCLTAQCLYGHVCVCVCSCTHIKCTDFPMNCNIELVRFVQKSHTQIIGQIVEIFEAEKMLAQHNECLPAIFIMTCCSFYCLTNRMLCSTVSFLVRHNNE